MSKELEMDKTQDFSYSFELDDAHAAVFIRTSLDVFRINCQDPVVMIFWARFWYGRECPFANDSAKNSFYSSFSLFLEANREKIEALTKEIKIRRRESYALLMTEIKSHLRKEPEEDARDYFKK